MQKINSQIFLRVKYLPETGYKNGLAEICQEITHTYVDPKMYN